MHRHGWTRRSFVPDSAGRLGAEPETVSLPPTTRRSVPMLAARIRAARPASPRPLAVVRMCMHLVALGVAYDGLHASARLGSGLIGRARRRLHRIDPPPETIYDSLGVRR